MRISINDLLEMLAAEAVERDAQPEQPDYDTEGTEFDNNEDAIRNLFDAAITGKDFGTAYRSIELANKLQINLLQKA